MWLLIDNYDSFTYILADTIQQFHKKLKVIKNDEWTLAEIIAFNPERIILSPGPGKPEDAILSIAVVDYFKDKIPILGICLGHQVIGEYFGAKCLPSGNPLHGVVSTMKILQNDSLFEDVTDKTIMHYHSLILEDLPQDKFETLAMDENNQIMAIRHKNRPILGLQFHPESVLTIDGKKMIANWIKNEVV